jgi:long-chain acyl-CoA synthetase
VDVQPRAVAATLPGRLRERATRTPDRVALRAKELGIWREVRWAEYWETVQDVAHGLVALGVQPGDRVAILAQSRLEWAYVDLAAMCARAVPAGIPPGGPPEETAALLAETEARLLVTDDPEQAEWMLAEPAGAAPPQVVLLEEAANPAALAWRELLEHGRRRRTQHPEPLAGSETHAAAVLAFTVGTTGRPRAIALSGADVELAVGALMEDGVLASPPPGPKDDLLAALPPAIVGQRAATTWLGLAAGCAVSFAESPETVPQDLRELQPTLVAWPPRAWERLHAQVLAQARGPSRLKRAALGWGLRTGRRAGPLGALALLRPLRSRLGLARCRGALAAGAPAIPDVLAAFAGLGVPVRETYGITEGAVYATADRLGRAHPGTAGEPLPGVEVRLEEGSGEILLRLAGRDGDEWLRTGDAAEWAASGGLRVRGRMPGVAASELEARLAASPWVRGAIVVGEHAEALSALVAVEPELVGGWARRRGLVTTTHRELVERPEVIELVGQAVQQLGSAVAGARISRLVLLPEPLDPTRELTSLGTLRRPEVLERHGRLLGEPGA